MSTTTRVLQSPGVIILVVRSHGYSLIHLNVGLGDKITYLFYAHKGSLSTEIRIMSSASTANMWKARISKYLHYRSVTTNETR